MTEPFDSNTGTIITFSHQDLIAPVTGFAKEGKSVSGNKGLLIFIPTTIPETLIDLIKVVKKNDS